MLSPTANTEIRALQDCYGWGLIFVLNAKRPSYIKTKWAEAVEYAYTYEPCLNRCTGVCKPECVMTAEWYRMVIRNTDGFVQYPKTYEKIIEQAYASMVHIDA